MLKSLNTTKFVSVAILSVILAGCGVSSPNSTGTTTTVATSLAAAPLAANVYLAQAANSKEAQQRDTNLLLAAHAYINANDYAAAQKLLKSIQPSLTQSPTLLAEHKYLTARVLEHTSTYSDALKILNYPSNWSLPSWQMTAYHQFKAHLYQLNKQPIEQVRELSLLATYLPPAQASEVNNTIWQVLQPMHEQTLKAFTQEAKNPVFTGWLQLAYIAKHYAVDPSQLVRYLGEWQKQNPYHPAAAKLPADLDRALNAKPFTPKNIAVLLPLTGSRANAANAIRQGILASYMSKQNDHVAVNFFDTADDAARAYQQAVAAGAEFIIGPLLPTEIEQLQVMNAANAATINAATNAANTTNPEKIANTVAIAPPVPQLFLNQVDKFTPDPTKFYFALSPAQEAADAAEHLYQDGVTKPLLLASNDALGKRMAESFIQAWKKKSDNAVEVYYYDGGDQMKTTVQDALGVRDSQARIARIKELVGNSVQADFRSRQDIDAIYMISTPQDLTLLKAFIDVNFSVFTQPVPLYTSSRSRVENESTQTAQDLNNLTLSDAPWLMQNGEENLMVKTLFPSWNNNQKRLFVMGYDAMDLIGRLAQMRSFTGYQYNGRSGALSVSPDGIVNRQLSWGRYQRGSFRQL
ncbi:penicillin-binding protein activator [Shewanella morhuae]|uniref:Penicillin-binding protein activator LpoA n=1 Tax=Shewanella morhuae TaxID=365591 RepID=A0A380B1V5_9GAMM|nr:penicillin-binding protein activator [Shewanella morhuae]SUI91269.1 Penicillin-binding protein activator LpoA precursor [Shewanella morhuae]